MKNTLPTKLALIGATIAAGSISASAASVLVAGWDNFNNSSAPETSAATFVGAGTTAALSGSTNWDDWNNNTFGASGDGTYGSLTGYLADTNIGTGSNQGTN
ncbi:MAG: hypothetical protein KJO79_00210, partial [Verrucomicrobiae bacterium]|nr:hypothetical protein [Verrucomicrobiae bacterium]NNJ85568.1 hypothetical protein [Akkermansiaceae bacterium]